jgi:hypothetical protein
MLRQLEGVFFSVYVFSVHGFSVNDFGTDRLLLEVLSKVLSAVLSVVDRDNTQCLDVTVCIANRNVFLQDKVEVDALVRRSLALFLGDLVLDRQECRRQWCSVILIVGTAEFGNTFVQFRIASSGL